MWSKRWLASLLLFCLFFGAAARAEDAKPDVFPRSDVVFRKLLADPREIQLGASYYRLGGVNSADAALGHSWGMARWALGRGAWLLQWDVAAMAYSRFRLSGAVNEFETVDFFANLPVEVRRDWASGRFMLFHQSSHLGDDYIRRTGDAGFRYSVDGLRGQLSVDWREMARAYVGGTYLLHTIPSPDRGAVQAGLEFQSSDYQFEGYPWKAYLAQDFQSHSNVRWNANSYTVLGIKMHLKTAERGMRLHVGYFTGHSPYGQFYRQREHYADVGISLDF